MLRTAIRVNPIGYEQNCVTLDSEIREISISHSQEGIGAAAGQGAHPESWIVDELYDIQNIRVRYPQFARQNDVYLSFDNWIQSASANSLYCVALGPRNSGKSFTLFGENSLRNQGIIPRFIRSLFEQNRNTLVVQISMYLAYSNYFVDLLKPPTQHSYTNNVIHSTSLGVTLLPLKSISSTSFENALQILNLGLMAASMISLNSSDIFQTSHLITTIRIISPERFYSVTFLELSSLIFFPTFLTESDRLSSSCHEINSVNALSYCGLYGDASQEDANGYKSKSNQAIRAMLQLAGPHETSFLTYLLQDAFQLRTSHSHPTTSDPAHRNQSYLIGCINSSNSTISDSKITLDLIHSISEKIHSNEKQKPIEISRSISHAGSYDNLNEAMLSPKPKVEIQTITQLIEELNHEIDQISRLLDNLNEEKIAQEGEANQSSKGSFKGSSVTSNACKTNDEILKVFNERKLAYFLFVKEMVMRPYNQITLSNQSVHKDITTIQKWLKQRGVFGMKLLLESEEKKSKLNPSSSNPIDNEVEQLPIPWSSPTSNRPNEPHLVPITPINLSKNFLSILIPAGHTAICYEPISVVDNSNTSKISFPGLKHCKLFRLDGLAIRSKHCIIFRLGTNVKIRPFPNTDPDTTDNDEDEGVIVYVNGRIIQEETVLKDLDTITLGIDKIFMVHIPMSDEEQEQAEQQFNDQEEPKISATQSPIMRQKSLESLSNPSLIQTNLILTKEELLTNTWDNCIVSGYQGDLLKLILVHLMNQNHYRHSLVDRQFIPITKIADLTEEMKLESYVPPLSMVYDLILSLSSPHRTCLVELLIAIRLLNYYSKSLRRMISFDINLKKYQPKESSFIPRQYRGTEEGIQLGNENHIVEIRCEILEGVAAGPIGATTAADDATGITLCRGDRRGTSKGDSWIWSSLIFLQRYLQISSMYHRSFLENCNMNLEQLDEIYPPAVDPFYDPSVPELIGISTLHTDSLYYLIDTKDTLPIITFKGHHGGLLKLSVRIWINKVETVPSYISVDKESKLIDFLGQKAIIRFYFESLLNIPRGLSNDLQIIYTFYSHTGQYRTSRSPAMNVVMGDNHCFLNQYVVIEQKITPDFIKYIQQKCIEFEIWGTRITNRQYVPASSSTNLSKIIRIGEPARLKKRGKKMAIGKTVDHISADIEIVHHDGEEEIQHDPIEPENEQDDDEERDDNDPLLLKNKIKEMAIQLEKAEKNMRKTTKAASTYRDELTRMNSKANIREQSIIGTVAEKENKIKELEKELNRLKEEAAEKERLFKLEQEQKAKSRVCVIS